MSEVWDATYQAVRSKIHNGDVGSAISHAVQDSGLSTVLSNIQEIARQAFAEYERPSIMLRPKVSIDGNMYCALYGENPMEGIVGYGPSVAEAFRDFDQNFYKKDLK